MMNVLPSPVSSLSSLSVLLLRKACAFTVGCPVGDNWLPQSQSRPIALCRRSGDFRGFTGCRGRFHWASPLSRMRYFCFTFWLHRPSPFFAASQEGKCVFLVELFRWEMSLPEEKIPLSGSSRLPRIGIGARSGCWRRRLHARRQTDLRFSRESPTPELREAMASSGPAEWYNSLPQITRCARRPPSSLFLAERQALFFLTD